MPNPIPPALFAVSLDEASGSLVLSDAHGARIGTFAEGADAGKQLERVLRVHARRAMDSGPRAEPKAEPRSEAKPTAKATKAKGQPSGKGWDNLLGFVRDAMDLADAVGGTPK